MDWQAFSLSIELAAVTLLVLLPPGVLGARWLARTRFSGKAWVWPGTNGQPTRYLFLGGLGGFCRAAEQTASEPAAGAVLEENITALGTPLVRAIFPPW